MSQPTKEQWEEIALNMDRFFNPVYLDCDGYLISSRMVRDRNKLVIEVYVDGFIRGEWCQYVKSIDEFSDIPKRFYRHVKKQLMSGKELKAYEKAFSKRYCRQRGYYDPRYLSYPHWNSVKSLIRHLKKYNEVIEWIDKETHDQRLTAKKSQEQTA